MLVLFAVLLSGTALLVLYTFGNASAETQRRAEFTRAVLDEAQEISLVIKYLESTEDSYVRTGDSSLLEGYAAGRREVFSGLENLDTLTAHNAVQQRRVDTLTCLVQQSCTLWAGTFCNAPGRLPGTLKPPNWKPRA
jgi:CHASE3 domain sensor protein